jgi:hypothetical protein
MEWRIADQVIEEEKKSEVSDNESEEFKNALSSHEMQ